MKNFSRRDLIKAGATVGVASQLGMDFRGEIAGTPLGFLEALARGDFQSVARAAESKSQYTLVHIVLIDKVQSALFQSMAGTPPLGADANGGIATTVQDFRGMALTKLFADPLAGLPTNISLSMNNAWESGNGGHSLQNSLVSADLGGINNAYEKLSGGTGLLGAVGFGIRSDANDSADAFTSSGGRKLNAFTGVDQLTTTLQNSVRPLLNTGNLALLKKFDGLVSSEAKFRDTLVELARKVGEAIPLLNEAKAITDPVSQQVKTVIALHKAGVAKNFMIAVPWDDTNGGGNLTSKGGSRNLDPFSATPLIAGALVELHLNIPDLVCVTTSDGGRSQNNGDQSAGFALMTGPDSIIKNGFVGNLTYTTTDQLGRNIGDLTLSSGNKMVTRPSHWYATALKAMGLDSQVDYVPEALIVK